MLFIIVIVVDRHLAQSQNNWVIYFKANFDSFYLGEKVRILSNPSFQNEVQKQFEFQQFK